MFKFLWDFGILEGETEYRQVFMVKFTIISTLREGEDTILASGGEGFLS
ncbi:MAG: hypothetical protein OYL97_01210 [Candidatus Poribacteria bacterium]|nr:hypothetical protein [Candidatus Poribacteria bacterium]